MNAKPGFIFGGNTPWSYEELQRKRGIADQLLQANSRTPQNVGEGIAAIGRALASRSLGKKADKREGELRSEFSNDFNSKLGGILGGNASPSYASPGSFAPASPNQDIADDAMAVLGKQGGYRESLIGTESGGNFQAKNNEVGSGGKRGHFGRVQFGHARLQDAMNAGVIPQGTTPEQFMASPQMQVEAENWHFADLEEKLAPYVGTVVNGKPLDMGALVAMGHLGGYGGAKKFVETGGQYNPSDSFGTSLADYAETHGSFAPGPGTQVAQGGGMQGILDIANLMSNPMATPGQKAVMSALLQQKMAAMQPQSEMEALQMQKLEAEIQRMQKPEPGFESVSLAEVESLGLPEGAYQRGPDGKVYQIGGSGQTINNNMPGSQPTPELLGTQGLVAIPDPNSPQGWRVEAAPGSPLAQDQAADEDKRELRAGMANTSSDVVITSAGRARQAAEERLVGGYVGQAAGALNPANANAEIARQVSTLQSMAAAENINAMRQASPTGGALGNASDADILLLKNKSGALDPRSPNFIRDLDDYERTLLRTIHGDAAGDQIYNQTRKDTKAGATDFSQMTIADVGQVDIGSLTPQQMDALEARMQELGL